jgi:hypothetical protein
VETQRTQYTKIDITRPLNTCGFFTSDFAFIEYLSIILSIFYLLPLADACQKNFFIIFSPNAESRLDIHNPDLALTFFNAIAMPKNNDIGWKFTYAGWTTMRMITIFFV